MSYTYPRGSRRAFGKALLFSAGGGCFLLGCAAPAMVHSGYAGLQPGTVAVLPVRNDTVVPLDHVSFGGALQRITTGPRVYDFRVLLRSSLLEALDRRGYRAVPYRWTGEEPDFTRPLPAGSSELPFEAVLSARVTSFQAGSGTSGGISMTCRVDLYRVPTGELLYSRESRCHYTPDPRQRGPQMIPGFVRRCALKSLQSLPEAQRAKGRE